jgi:hypothetical protein
MAKKYKSDPLTVTIILILVGTVTFAVAKLYIENIDSMRDNNVTKFDKS